jgi:hypothetical protein
MVKVVALLSHIEAVHWIRIGECASGSLSLLRAKRLIWRHPRRIVGKKALAAARFVSLRHEPMERQRYERAHAARPQGVMRHLKQGASNRSLQCAEKLHQFYERAPAHQVRRQHRGRTKPFIPPLAGQYGPHAIKRRPPR